MYSYQIFHKVNKIEEHLLDLKLTDLDAHGNKNITDIRDMVNSPKIFGHLSDEDLNRLEKGEQITLTIQETTTLKLELV